MSSIFPCPGCGFLVFDEPPGSFAICPVCDWEDDNVQAADACYKGGANGKSLAEHQHLVLLKFPLHVRQHKCFQRASGWQPVQ
jgi:Cysteine-rich CPCC